MESANESKSKQLTTTGTVVASISLPKSGGAIHGIGEKFAANPVTGTGAMSVPIATSPGRSGFSPQLSLSYDSGSGNGPFGFGWSLGLPQISRKTDKGLPRYRDGEESDVFILSGSEDLVPVLRPDGIRFKDDTTQPGYVIHRYRPRIEGLFARIERWTRISDNDVHWRSISKDNVVALYGKDENARIVDSSNPDLVFSWLICETRDDKGNAVVYSYKPEDGAGIDLGQAHERNRGGVNDARRSTNRYLKRIQYGNRKCFLDGFGRRPGSLDASDIQNADWMFEVVFDYGDHDDHAPKPDDAGEWVYRLDPFSTYRSGFEVRTCRLCQRVLMFHHFARETGVGKDCLVRSTDFNYSYEENPGNARNPIYSFLVSVSQSGYKRTGSGYLKRSMPPVEFEYSQPLVQDRSEAVDSTSLENLPAGLDGVTYQWTDLHGEGISGVLTEQGTAWFYKRNLSPINEKIENGTLYKTAKFAPIELVSSKPDLALAPGFVQFMDLAGDGQTDLIMMDGVTPGFYEHDVNEGWQAFRPFTAWINRESHDPNLKFVDLDGDGRVDVLITEGNAFVWHLSLAEHGFAPALRVPQAIDEEKGPRLVFADGTQSIYLADLSGDGLSDVVRIRNGELCYWPNLGYGRFGAKVTMDNSPWFDNPDQFDQKRIRLADIDGSGTTDIIYLHRDGVHLYFNQCGNSWSDPRILEVFPRVEDLVSILPVDLLGNGTACLVWSSPLAGDAPRQMRYVKLMGEEKPHLLIGVKNNLGAETKIHYAPSTKFYLLDKQDGTPWLTKLPFPVHVVESVETFDPISKNHFVSSYKYHHGYFDGDEREFRGFGMVEQWDTAEFAKLDQSAANVDRSWHVPPIHTKTWFHTGAYLRERGISQHLAHEYFGAPQDKTEFEAWANTNLLDDTVLPDVIHTSDEIREASRALKGSMLRQELYADDRSAKEGIPYRVSEQNHTVECLQAQGTNRHAVFFSHPREAINYHYERNLVDPRVTHAITLETDAYGNVLRSVEIGYGRKDSPLAEQSDRDKQNTTLITYAESRVTTAIDETSQFPDHYRTPLPAEVRTYELTGFKPNDNTPRFSFREFAENDFKILTSVEEIPYLEIADSNKKQKRIIEHIRTLYRKDDLSGLLPLSGLETLALSGESYKLSLTPELLNLYKRGTDDLLPLSDREKILQVEGGYILSGDYKASSLFPSSDPIDNWWVPSGRIFYSPDATDSADQELNFACAHFFLPHRSRDPFNQSTIVAYDSSDTDPETNNNLLVVTTEDALQNTVTALQDYRVLQPRLVSDPNGNRTEVAFDTLGMVVATTVMGKPGENLGDLSEGFDADPLIASLQTLVADPQGQAAAFLGKATTRIVYDLDRFQRASQPPFAATLVRKTHFNDPDGPQTKIQISFSYFDGFGREIQKKIQAESGDAPQRLGDVLLPTGDIRPGDLVLNNADTAVPANSARRWVGSGRTIYNNKAKPVRQYEPFFSATHLYEPEREMTDTGVGSTLFYDPVDRVVARLHPEHTWEKVVFDPWRQTTYDVNDTVLNADGSTDPRADEDVKGFFSLLADADYLPTWYERRMVLPSTDPDRVAAAKASVHRQTPTVAHFDSLGRTFLAVAHNRFERGGVTVEEMYPTRIELDVEGNQRAVRDAIVQNSEPIGRIVMESDYDMLGNRIRRASMEASESWMLNDVTGKPIRAWDNRGFMREMKYDELRRPIELCVTENGVRRLAELTLYGEGQGDAYNHRTRVYKVFDGAGVVTNEVYDFKGNLLRSTRDLLPISISKQSVDWSQNPSANDGSFTSSRTYDALNRTVTATTPDNSVYLPTFNEANLLDRVDVYLQGAAVTTPFVTNINYNAKGQRELISYQNGAVTTYKYDPFTFRLTSLKTTRPAGGNGLTSQLFTVETIVQDLRYFHDPAGNITCIEDAAPKSIFYNNEQVEPVCEYVYDAIYRLIEATGREHIGQTAHDFDPPEGNQRDYPFFGQHANPSDWQAMRNYIERYIYDAVGNFESMIHQASSNGGWTRTYEYNESSLIEPAKQSNRLSKTTIGNGTNFVETYTYTDALGHDVSGCMTSISAMKLTWDFKDQLQRVELSGGGTAYYIYDASGQRIRKVTESQNGATKKERIYIGGFEIYREFNGNSVKLERETLHVMDDKQRIAMIETRTLDVGGDDPATPQLIRYQFCNHLGSTSLELDEHAQIISYEEYSPYGNSTYQSLRNQTETPKRYRYTGVERDEETGLAYHTARYYVPSLGRWTSCDPLEKETDLYVYCASNPVRRSDPLGTDWELTLDPREWAPVEFFKEEVAPRAVGVLKVGAGFAGMTAGFLLCDTGLGCVLGAPLMVVSADVGGSGISQGWHGSPQPTVVGSLAGPKAQAFEENFVGAAGLALGAVDIYSYWRFGKTVSSSLAPGTLGGVGNATKTAAAAEVASDATAGRSLFVGPERASEFAEAEVAMARGKDVTAVNPKRTAAADAFEEAGGKFHEGKVQDLPPQVFDEVVENFPQPYGRTMQAVHEMESRFVRVAPGGKLRITTEDATLRDMYLQEAQARGFSDVGTTAYSVEGFKATGQDLPSYISAHADALRVKAIYVLNLTAPR